MNKNQKKLVAGLAVISLVSAVAPTANAMHIMEGFLPPLYCIAWGVLCIPFLAAGFFRFKKLVMDNRRLLLILAMSGAYAFVLSALKIPSVTGSSSHMTGTGLGALLFGPSIMSILGGIVLLFQALLLAHGGLTTLGANMFSMAIAGPFLAYGVYLLLKKCRVPKYICVFFAAFLGDLFTYCVTSLQLGVAYPATVGGVMSSVGEFLGIFAITQIPLAIIEGLITVVVIMGFESFASDELGSLKWFKGGVTNVR